MTESREHRNQHDFKANKSILPPWVKFGLFLFPVLIYLPGIFGKIPYPSESALYTDLLLSHYPNALFLKKSILEFHQIPLWSTIIHSGAPFAANPLSGLFYLPGWIALLFPLPEGISIVLGAHAVFAAWGMYLLLREEGSNDIGAVAGGLIVGLMPKIAAHYGAGHVSLIYAISWTPWLFLASKKDVRGWKTGLIAAFLFLADPRWSVYAGLLWITYDISYGHRGNLKDYSFYYLKTGFTALLIAAPLIVPLTEYVRLSTRPRMVLDDLLAFSLSPERILGLVIPTGGGNPEWYIYSGGVVLGLFLMQLLIKDIRTEYKFWVIWFGISIGISFGPWFISPSWLLEIPIISLLRVPARALFLMVFSFSFISAGSISYLVSSKVNIKNLKKIAFGLALGSVGLAVSISYLIGKFTLSGIWGLGFLLAFSIILMLRNRSINPKIWSWLIVGLIIIDLLGAGYQSFYLKDIVKADREIQTVMENDQDVFRLYSPSYSYPQYLAAENNMNMTDGVDPMQIAAYSDFMIKASGVYPAVYSVTIPAFESGNPKIDNVNVTPDAFLLGLLNVKYIISEFEINSPGFSEITNQNNVLFYKNNYFSKRAWIEFSPKSIENFQGPHIKNVSNLRISPNRIDVEAEGPGKLVISEINYPGWQVVVDGKKQPIELAYGLLRSVNLLEGNHEVEFNFRPLSVYVGLGMAMMGWMVVIWKTCINRKFD